MKKGRLSALFFDVFHARQHDRAQWRDDYVRDCDPQWGELALVTPEYAPGCLPLTFDRFELRPTLGVSVRPDVFGPAPYQLETPSR